MLALKLSVELYKSSAKVKITSSNLGSDTNNQFSISKNLKTKSENVAQSYSCDTWTTAETDINITDMTAVVYEDINELSHLWITC